MSLILVSTSGVWNTTTFVGGIPSGVGSGDWITLLSDPQNDIFQAVSTSSSGVTIVNPSGLSISSGTGPTYIVTDPELIGIQWETNSSGVPNVDQIPNQSLIGVQWETNSSGVTNVDQIPNLSLQGTQWETNSPYNPNVDQILYPIVLGIYFETNIPSGTFIEITLPASGIPIDQSALGFYGPYVAHVWAGDELTVRDTYTTRASALNRPPDRTTFRSV